MNAMTNTWIRVCRLEDILPLGARIIPAARGDIAVFRCRDDSVFAVRNRCPHKQGPLSEGIVHGRSVTCPLHGWVIDLETGQAAAPDIGCTPKLPVRVIDGAVWLSAEGAG
jgi:nitrite reductase (NADH) small subunit